MFSFFSRKTVTIAEPVAEIPARVGFDASEDFTLYAVEETPSLDLLGELRIRTIEFADDNGLGWAITRIIIQGVDVQVKLTENWDVAYTIDHMVCFDRKEAAAWLDECRAAVVEF